MKMGNAEATVASSKGGSGDRCCPSAFSSNSCGCSWWDVLVLLPGKLNLGLQLHAQVRLNVVFPGVEQVPVQASCLVYAPVQGGFQHFKLCFVYSEAWRRMYSAGRTIPCVNNGGTAATHQDRLPPQSCSATVRPEGMSCGSQPDGAVQRIAPEAHCLHIGLPHSACPAAPRRMHVMLRLHSGLARRWHHELCGARSLVAAILTDLVATQNLPACIQAPARAVESPGHLLHSKGHAASVPCPGHQCGSPAYSRFQCFSVHT